MMSRMEDYPGIETVSGAHVFVHGDHAVKWAPEGTPVADRIDLQAAWLLEHQHDFLPRVQKLISPGSYQMERLGAMPDFVDDEVLARLVLNRLSRLWDDPAEHAFDPRAHSAYVQERADRLGLVHELSTWWARIEPILARQPNCTVHGDPTIDNCMLRGEGELVITDPIPPGVCLPSVRALDVGKVIQSAMGYEEVACGRRPTTIPWLGSAFWEEALPDVDHDEWRLCLYMAAVHFLRLLPYTPQHSREWRLRIDELIEWGED
jgi:hypothetical protein